MNKQLTLSIFVTLLLLVSNNLSADNIIIYSDSSKIIQIKGEKIEVLEDPKNELTLDEVLKSKAFLYSTQTVPNFQISKSTFWAKIKVKNASSIEDIILSLEYPIIDNITFYKKNKDGTYQRKKIGEKTHIEKRKFKHQNYIFELNITPGETREYIIKIKGSEQMQLPLSIGQTNVILESLFNKDLIFGIYAGIILVMFFYNLFIYFVVKDITYIYYVSYIITVGATQALLQGYYFRFLWSDIPEIANISMIIWPSLSGVTALLFVISFLKVKANLPVYYKIIISIIIIYSIAISLGLFGKYHEAQEIVQLCAMSGSILVLVIAIKLYRRGNQEAALFLVAWSIFLLTVIIFVLRNFDFLPFNNFTNYSLQIGSSIEVVLLSFALANRINIIKKESLEFQLMAFDSLKENERIVKEQNIMLEAKVKERTIALQESISELKQTQTKLVSSEKMASLGQLTAGIAHEINNPINFVVSSVQPLRRDIKDIYELLNKFELITPESKIEEELKKISAFKKEIDFDYLQEEINKLLKGIEDGANRTAIIVKELRTFSRVDENVIKKINIIDGIESTLSLLNSSIKDQITIEKNYSENPILDCYPGKLNQVLMNILNNSIQAINSRKENGSSGIIKISTLTDEQYLYLTIEDNGIGMTEETKNKIFEPFFTTKAVGKGTGLGMSICHSIIESHSGSIEIETSFGKGTKLKITLPLEQSN